MKRAKSFLKREEIKRDSPVLKGEGIKEGYIFLNGEEMKRDNPVLIGRFNKR